MYVCTHTKTQKLCRPHKYYSAVQAQKNKNKKFLKLSHRPKTPLVACVFYFVLICTFFWLNVNRYTYFWHIPYI